MDVNILVYSTHNRSNYIHNDWIVQRALRGNRQILYLPMSQHPSGPDEYRRQVSTWNDFAWFFDYYAPYGLHAFPFYWNSNLSQSDIHHLFELLESCEVVILGGGNPWLGLSRYRALGGLLANDPNLFAKMLIHRRESGLLTVGYSAGVDQLCQFVSGSVEEPYSNPSGFGICSNIIGLSHFEHGREDILRSLACQYGICLVFGLPNDSGLGITQFHLSNGLICQIIYMIVDNSWDYPSDQHHIKTRQGVKIQHFYSDNRHWAFDGGDRLLRFQSSDGSFNEAFIVPANDRIKDYWTQEPIGDYSMEAIIQAFDKK